MKKGTLKITEAQIQQTCCEWLALDGWRRIRTDLKHLRGMGVQEKGMPDDLFIRYSGPASLSAAADVLWVEWKKPGGVNAQHQKAWAHIERTRGALVASAIADFEPSIEGFQKWYRDSGLMQREI